MAGAEAGSVMVRSGGGADEFRDRELESAAGKGDLGIELLLLTLGVVVRFGVDLLVDGDVKLTVLGATEEG